MTQHAATARRRYPGRTPATPSAGSPADATQPLSGGASLGGQAAVSPLAATAALADGVFSTLRMARALAESGRRIDVEGLDRLVGLLCAKALDLPPEDGRRMRLTLLDMLDDVDALSRSLRDGLPHGGLPA
ncbi:MAG: hypothetical protein JSR21_13650 [Proteobacteria bacterium]|nr:hypothetical protein [Pseudomonadota bacterium]